MVGRGREHILEETTTEVGVENKRWYRGSKESTCGPPHLPLSYSVPSAGNLLCLSLTPSLAVGSILLYLDVVLLSRSGTCVHAVSYLVKKTPCKKKIVTLQPQQQPIVIVPHEHHDDCDGDDLPTLCEHYRGKATVGRVRGEHRRVPPARRRRLLPGPRPPSRVLYSQPFFTERYVHMVEEVLSPTRPIWGPV